MTGQPISALPLQALSDAFCSLSATFFRNRIIGALRAAKQANAAAEVSQNFVFENPTVQRLAQAIAALVDPASTPAGPVVSPATEIEDMIAKYSADMPSRSATGGPTRDGVVVFLTGATGGIGSHILAALLADDRISRVYAFNRGLNPDEARGRQSAAFRDRGLPTELLSGRKYVALVGDLNEKRFGLAEDVFEEVGVFFDGFCALTSPSHEELGRPFGDRSHTQRVDGALQPSPPLVRKPHRWHPQTH